MKVATATYEHSKLVLVKADQSAIKIQVGKDKTATQIKIANPITAEALYAADTDKATDALLISDIKEKSILHIFSGTLDPAGTKATTFTIPEKEVPQADAQKLTGADKTFADLTKYATEFKWMSDGVNK